MDTIAAAEQYNDPGRFTAFIGYEWTSNTGSMNLHRNVIFRDGGDRARQVEPFTTMKPMGSDDPADLWKWMDAYEKKTGGSVLAIAHNGNLSNGLMFPVVEAFGKKLDRDYVETRAKWERLYETTQTKGTGESHPFLSPNDEFADFEIWDKGNLDGSAAKDKAMLEFEYARSAFKNGLKLEQQLGTNPYKFGLVGSTDAHTGLAAVEEDNFFGKTTPQEPSAERMRATFFKNPKTASRSWTGRSARPDTPPCGRRRTRAKRSGTRWSAAKPTRRRVRAWPSALLRRLRLHGGGCAHAKPGGDRVRERRADGR
jgi:hypothetical protein